MFLPTCTTRYGTVQAGKLRRRNATVRQWQAWSCGRSVGGVVPWVGEHESCYVSEGLAAYPELLNKYLVAKLVMAVRVLLQAGPLFARTAPEQPAARAQAVFTESVQWRDPLRGAIQPTDKEQADAVAIGGLRDTAESLSRLTYVAEYGARLGMTLKALDGKPSWIEDTCEAIGANDEERKAVGLGPARPPKDAIAAIPRLPTEHMAATIPSCTTARHTQCGRTLTGRLEGWSQGS